MNDFRGKTYKQICEALGVESLERAYLERADFRGVDLRWAIFRGAYLERAYFYKAYLERADFRGADLRWAIFRGANLRWAYLYRADLEGADFRGADLRWAIFRGANLRGADFRGANLEGADFEGAKNIPDMTWLTIAREGELIVYKKVSHGIAKLLIPADAERSNATTRKCRASKAIVLECPEGAVSLHDPDFKYKAGETVVPHEWCSDRWKECAGGIHFFLTKAEAEAY